MPRSQSSQSIPTTPFVRPRLSDPEIHIEVGLSPVEPRRAPPPPPPPPSSPPTLLPMPVLSPERASAPSLQPVAELPEPPSRLARRSAAITVPPRAPWPHRRRAAIAITAAALASFAGGAILRAGSSRPKHVPAIAASVQPPASPQQPPSPPQPPPPQPPPPAPAFVPAPSPSIRVPSSLPPSSSTITLRVTSRPPDATVFLDGVRVGRAPLHVAVARADRDATIKLRRSGYRSESITVTLDRDADLQILMQPKDPAP